MTTSNLLARAKANFERGNQLEKQGNINESIKSYRQAIQIKPNFVQSLLKLAEVYNSQENWSETTRCYQNLIGINPENHAFHLKLAKVLLKQEKVDQAIAAYTRAIELKPELSQQIYRQLATLLLQEKLVDHQQIIQHQVDSRKAYRKLKNALKEINKQNCFDIYIPLGDNCETGLQFVRTNYQVSSFFRFTLSPFEVTYRILQNDFQDIFAQEYIVPHPRSGTMVINTKYNIAFHSKLESKTNEETKRREFLSTYDFDSVFEQEVAKIKYLIDKWHKVMESEQKILFILKNDSEDKSLQEQEVSNLCDLLLEKYQNHNFKIVCLQLEKFREAKWNNPYLINKYFTNFAPRSSAKKANIAAWNQLFNEFPLSS
jgi:tetratricopeptide (TPR) repeat protein